MSDVVTRTHHWRSLTDAPRPSRAVLRESDRPRHLGVAGASTDRRSQANGAARADTTLAISRAVVSLLRARTGTEPIKVKTEMSSGLAIVTLGGRLASAEKPGSEDQGAETGLCTAVYQGMRADAIAAVEAITGRHVVAYLTDHQPEPDLAVMVFVFGPSAPSRP